MVDLAAARVIAILTRAPSSGGKGRLFAELGRPPDRGLLEALLLDTIDGATAPATRMVIAVTPGSACDEIRALTRRLKAARAADVLVIPQSEGHLGDRMQGTMARLFASGAKAVALVGSDVPEITASSAATAFDVLASDPDALVLGPAADGGYYLIAATRVPDVFGGIEWGSADVLEQTQRVARARGLHVRLLGTLADVDTADDLRRMARSAHAPRTAAWVRAQLR